MERLTKTYSDGSFGVADNLPCGENSYTFKNLLIRKLGEYEDLEEQGRHTNADRIRNMSDEELAEFLITFKNTFGEEYEGETSCMEWLQSEAE